MRIVLHAGFHKTGTTSLQSALAAHRAALSPQWVVQTAALSRPLGRVGKAALAASADPATLGELRTALALWVAGLRPGPGRLISCEDMVGHMPGRHGVQDYAAACRLLPEVVQALTTRLPGAVVEVLLTTRAGPDWLRSIHWQLSKHPEMQLSARGFARRYAGAADPGPVVQALGPLLAPARLHVVPLKVLAPRRLGPVEAVYDLAGLPDALRARLPPVPRVDRSTPLDLADTFARLNRAGLDPEELDRMKHEMVTLARLLVEEKPPLSSGPSMD
ncbi:hypothetical protein MASR2M74_27360 [Paracoccaceae bacterium]